jgi:hypothetical protein
MWHLLENDTELPLQFKCARLANGEKSLQM